MFQKYLQIIYIINLINFIFIPSKLIIKTRRNLTNVIITPKFKTGTGFCNKLIFNSIKIILSCDQILSKKEQKFWIGRKLTNSKEYGLTKSILVFVYF